MGVSRGYALTDPYITTQGYASWQNTHMATLTATKQECPPPLICRGITTTSMGGQQQRRLAPPAGAGLGCDRGHKHTQMQAHAPKILAIYCGTLQHAVALRAAGLSIFFESWQQAGLQHHYSWAGYGRV